MLVLESIATETEVDFREVRKCPFCREAIADDATRCPHCTAVIDDAAAAK